MFSRIGYSWRKTFKSTSSRVGDLLNFGKKIILRAPQMSEVEPSVEQPEDRSSAIVLVHFCAEPSPRPPREVENFFKRFLQKKLFFS